MSHEGQHEYEDCRDDERVDYARLAETHRRCAEIKAQIRRRYLTEDQLKEAEP